ncbi:hypothetical protein QVD17_31297 [Tagetes erecta]|uniref:Uncharacterized protein n=1 Tax=Tagetes erecta TaxID=13708 RepID=A0AAD8K4A1_TARER|nr:hypothetical protein QVD17_31297 [Tagetes erecta]
MARLGWRHSRRTYRKVWSIVSQTERLPEWMPMVETCTHLKGTEGEPGYVRLVSGFMFPQEDGDRSWIKERLVSMDPLTHSYVYKMEASNVGLDGSINTLKLVDKMTFDHWHYCQCALYNLVRIVHHSTKKLEV